MSSHRIVVSGPSPEAQKRSVAASAETSAQPKRSGRTSRPRLRLRLFRLFSISTDSHFDAACPSPYGAPVLSLPGMALPPPKMKLATEDDVPRPKKDKGQVLSHAPPFFKTECARRGSDAGVRPVPPCQHIEPYDRGREPRTDVWTCVDSDSEASGVSRPCPPLRMSALHFGCVGELATRRSAR